MHEDSLRELCLHKKGEMGEKQMDAKERIRELHQKHADTRRQLSILMGIWLLVRVVYEVDLYICVARGYVSTLVWADILSLVFSFILAYYILYGMKALAWLPLIGGVRTIGSIAQQMVDLGDLSQYYMAAQMYVYLSLAVGIVMVVVMCVVLFNKKYQPYFDEYIALQKQIREEKKAAKDR